MILYHGTFEEFYKGIELDKAIRPKFSINAETDLIDVALNDFLGDVNIRDGAVFLFNNTKYLKSYEYVFKLNVDTLNKNLLYVADFRISTDIYDSIMRGKEDGFIKKLCENYANSFMSFGGYLCNKGKIEIPEFLYFGEVELNSAKIVVLNY